MITETENEVLEMNVTLPITLEDTKSKLFDRTNFSCQVFKFRRGRKKTLTTKNRLLYENEIMVEIPDEATDEQAKSIDYLKQPIFKYKLGDGIHRWNQLQYQQGVIPVIIVTSKGERVESGLYRREKSEWYDQWVKVDEDEIGE